MKDANNILIWSCRFQWEHFSKIWRKITDFHVQKRNKQIFVSYGLGEIIALPWKLNGQSLSNLYTCKGSRILGFVSLLQQGTSLNKYIYNANGADVVEWSRALDLRLSDWCCSVSMVWVQIPSREEQKFDSSKI
jgi:hypothetical protein